MNEEQKDFYKKLRGEIKDWINTKGGKDNRWADYILLAPDLFHLLIKLSLDKEVPVDKKVRLGAVIAYFILPLDFLPEILLGPVGYLDDVVISAYILNELFNSIDPKIITRHWAGDRDLLNSVRTIIANANELVGKGLLQKIKSKFKIRF
jgi:uncharacterized membrane protein YkvA (DUF1232 family)